MKLQLKILIPIIVNCRAPDFEQRNYASSFIVKPPERHIQQHGRRSRQYEAQHKPPHVGKPDGWVLVPGNGDRDIEVYHAYDEEFGLMSVVRAEENDVFASLNTMRYIAVMVVLAAALLGALLVFLLLRPIVVSLNKGVVFAKDIAAGKLDSHLAVRRNDEIGQLADALRTIPESLNSITAE
jgi:methyl-accepting chemotaxis protein